MMRPDDPRHGTTAGYQEHRKLGEKACDACVAAKTRYEKIRHVYGDRMVPALGTRRRIWALKAMGHSGADIALVIGGTYQAVHKIENGTASKIRAITAMRVSDAYERLSMQEPTGFHRNRIRNMSARRGYVPPLAWDNIDDPDEQPTDWAYRAPTRAEIVADLDEKGAGISEVCKALDITPKSLERWCVRNGQWELFKRIRGREYVAQEYRNQWTKEAG